MENEKVYIVPARLISRLDEICIELQSLFLEVYANHEVAVTKNTIVALETLAEECYNQLH